jgi:glycosyltransferase involved in cell wall biosynthesis
VENLGLACADIITVNSDAMSEELRTRSRKLDLPLKPIHVIPNGVDLATFDPCSDWPADDGYVLFVGRLVAQKGVEYLIRAFYYAHAHERFRDVRLKIVGDGELDSELKALAKNLLLSDEQVEFESTSPWLTRPEVANLYQRARVVVVPSIDEPFGMTALEALACQRPVLATNVGGLPKLITPNVNGFLAEARDELDLAQWLMTLLADGALRARLGQEGRAGLGTKYTWLAIAQQFIGLYRGLRGPVDKTVPRAADQFKDEISRVAHELDPGISSELGDLFDWETRS